MRRRGLYGRLPPDEFRTRPGRSEFPQIVNIYFSVKDRSEQDIHGSRRALAPGFPAGPCFFAELEDACHFFLSDTDFCAQVAELVRRQDAQIASFGGVELFNCVIVQKNFVGFRVAPSIHLYPARFRDGGTVRRGNIDRLSSSYVDPTFNRWRFHRTSPFNGLWLEKMMITVLSGKSPIFPYMRVFENEKKNSYASHGGFISDTWLPQIWSFESASIIALSQSCSHASGNVAAQSFFARCVLTTRCCDPDRNASITDVLHLRGIREGCFLFPAIRYQLILHLQVFVLSR